MQSALATANQAFQKGEAAAAMSGYVSALLKMPELGETISGNIARTKQHYLKSRSADKPHKAVVCGWELAHNAAGRAHTLAEIYRELTSDVQIIGSVFPRWGREVWEPIRNISIPIDCFVVDKPERFIEQAMALVATHPADVVHLSKPRAPNIYFGIFYKLLWGAKVIVDIDDEELAFVKAETPISLSEYLEDYPTLPPFDQLTEAHWTRIAVGMAQEFDGVTVSNSALQRQYGGVVIGHARDPNIFKPSSELRQKSRQEMGIQPHQKVVLFSGTPRPHKGLLEVAEAIKALKRDDIIFVISGSFGKNHQNLKSKLKAVTNVKYIFLENTPFSELPNILAIADCCVLLQDANHPISKYQIPAKLSDALGMGVPVIVSATEALEHLIDSAAVNVSTLKELSINISGLIDSQGINYGCNGRRFFLDNLTVDACKLQLQKAINHCKKKSISNKLLKILNNSHGECSKFLLP